MGMWRYGRRADFVLHSSFIAISVFVFCTLLYGSTRFRLPLEPLFIGFGALYIVDKWMQCSKHRVFVFGYVLFHILIWFIEEEMRGLVLELLRLLGLK